MTRFINITAITNNNCFSKHEGILSIIILACYAWYEICSSYMSSQCQECFMFIMLVDYRTLLIHYLHCTRQIIERYFSRALSVKLTLLLTFQRRVDELLEAFVLEPSKKSSWSLSASKEIDRSPFLTCYLQKLLSYRNHFEVFKCNVVADPLYDLWYHL
jgi:hypothetical protein